MTTYGRLFTFVAGLALLCAGPPQARRRHHRVSCRDAASCNELGRQAFKRGDIATAIRLFKLQVGYAEDARENEESAVAYNNLAVVYMREHEYFRALAWTHLALRADAVSAAAKHDLAEIQKHTASYPWPTGVGGTYVRYAGRAYWSSLCVSEKEKNELDFGLIIYRLGAAWRRYGPAGYGDRKGKAVLTSSGEGHYAGSGDFSSCQIDMKFAKDGATLEQRGDCGFGYGVRAVGHYERISPRDNSKCDGRNLP